VDPVYPRLAWLDSGMDVVDNEEVAEGGGMAMTGDVEGPSISDTYLSPNSRISLKKGSRFIGCFCRNFASLIDLPTLEMIRGSIVIAAFFSSSVYPRMFALSKVLI